MPVRSSSHNPVFNEGTFDRFSQTGAQAEGRMTLRGTLDRAYILFAVAVAAAAVSGVLTATSPGFAIPALAIGGVLAFVLALVVAFNPTLASSLGIAYAVAKGVALGAITTVLERVYPGIGLQAIVSTGVITGVMLLLYRSRIIRATPTFKKVVIGLTIAAVLMYVVSFVVSVAGVRVPYINDATPLGIGISLFLIGLAAFNLILDFDLIEQGTEQGAPKHMEWYCAFALLVTVAWIYIEALRLLSKLRR